MIPYNPLLNTDPTHDDAYDEHCCLKGGVKIPGWFNIEVIFSTFEDFKAAEEGFRDAGYAVEMCCDAVDEYSDMTFGIISKPAGTATVDELFEQALALTEELGGSADCGGIVGEPEDPQGWQPANRGWLL